MTDTAYADPRMPLGVGRIIGDTFSTLFRKLPAILVLAFVPALVELILGYALAGRVGSLIGVGSAFAGGGFISLFVVPFLMSLVIGSIVTAAIVQLAYDAKLNRPIRIGKYIAAAIKHLPVVFILSVAAAFLYALGFSLFFVPGFWLFAVFSVFVPTIVIEGEGFHALGRSGELTKNYRWPIFGALVLVYLCLILITFVVGVASLLAASASAAGAIFVAIFLEAAGDALGYGAVSVATALIFARLKEIKEGVSVSDLVDVFR